MKPRRLQPLYPMLSAANRRLALAPIAKPGTAAANYTASMQTENPSAPTAGSAEELDEDDARAHAHVGDPNLA